MPAILNETAVRTLGWSSLEEALNKKFQDGNPDVITIGIVKDFHYTGLQKPIEPFAISLRGGNQHLTLEIDTENISHTLAFIESKFKQS